MWGLERIEGMSQEQRHSRLLYSILMESLLSLQLAGEKKSPIIAKKQGPHGASITLTEYDEAFEDERQTAHNWRNILAHSMPLFWPDGSVQIIENRDYKKLGKAKDPMSVPLGKQLSAENWLRFVAAIVAVAIPRRKVTITDSEGNIISESHSPVPLHDQVRYLDWWMTQWCALPVD